MRHFVTGAAGFIGAAGRSSAGARRDGGRLRQFLDRHRRVPRAGAQRIAAFTLVEGDLSRRSAAGARRCAAVDFVFHLAANADVRFGIEHPRKDLEQNTIATFNVLEAMRANGVGTIAFSSTGSIYGEAAGVSDAGGCALSGADLALRRLEARRRRADQRLLRGLRLPGLIFRFVSILGERYTHGHVFDFYKKLPADPTTSARARQRPAAQVLSLRAGLHRCDADRAIAQGDRQGEYLQPRHRRILRGQRFDWLDLAAISASIPS